MSTVDEVIETSGDGSLLDVDAQLDRFRKRLLDLTKRNRLLNFRRGRRTLAVIDELPDHIYKHLVRDNRAFLLDSIEGEDSEAEQQPHDIELPFPEADPVREHPRHRDDRLQTSLSPDRLETTLAAIRRDANSGIEETGVNHLFLALGMLRWYESSTSESKNDAPLLLIPASLSREFDERVGRYDYPLRWSGEEVQYNPCLQEMLALDFGLRLPELDDDETPETYFERVQEAVAGEAQRDKRWEVRREATLGFFSFTKLLMYRDLKSSNWREVKSLGSHPLVRQLFMGGESQSSGGADSSTIYAADYQIDARADAGNFPLVENADSSQHSALIDIVGGRNLVIEGPPGTGKSQTITNAIAAAIAAGKTVLFVSEKMAALEVVRSKLDGLGLGSLCLELHSNKAKPKDVFGDLKDRLDQTYRPAPSFERERSLLAAEQDKLRRYLQATEKIVGPFEEPLYELFWRVVELRGRGLSPLREADVNCDWSHAQVEDRRTCFDTLARHADEIGSPQSHPWRWFHCLNYRIADEPAVVEALELLQRAASTLQNETLLLKEQTGMEWALVPEYFERCSTAAINGLALDSVPFSASAAAPLLLTKSAESTAKTLLGHLSRHRELRPAAEANCRGALEETVAPAQGVDQLIESRFNASANGTTLEQVGEMAIFVQNALRTLVEVERHGEVLEQLGHGLPHALRDYTAGADRHGLVTHPAIGDGAILVAEHFYASAPRAVAEGRSHAELLLSHRTELDKTFAIDDVPADSDLADLRRRLRQHGSSWMRLLSGDYRDAKRRVRGILRSAVKFRPLQAADFLAQLEKHLGLVSAFRENRKARQLLGPHFAGIKTDWEELSETVRWAELARSKGIGYEEAKQLLDRLQQVDGAADAEQIRDAGRLLSSQIEADQIRGLVGELSGRLDSMPLSELRRQLEALLEDLQMLRRSLGFLDLAGTASLSEAQHASQQIVAVAELRQRIERDRANQDLLGADFQGVETQIEPLRMTMDWARRVRPLSLPRHVVEWLVHGVVRAKASALHERLVAASDAAASWRSGLSRMTAYGTASADQWFEPVGDAKGADPLAACVESLATLRGELPTLSPWSDWCRAVDRGSQLGLSKFVEAVATGELDPAEAKPTFELTLYDQIAHRAIREEPILGRFSRQQMEQVRADFQRLDQRLLELSREQVAYDASQRHVPRGVSTGRVKDRTELSLIRNEVNKQQRHCRIRQLVSRAGTALQALKPCFMMSPLSVAHFLPPGEIQFDLVVMDEASQVRPEDALGAVARGRQLVVVGDPKQLPPTSFWDKVDDGEVPEDEQTIADETESILEVALKAFPLARRLKWHYRSRHESLIAFSNDRFYDGDLVVFPSPTVEGIDGGRLGVHVRRVKDGAYKSKQGNLVEAQAIADAVVRHALEWPELSLGVGTFNVIQRDLIDACIDRRCIEDSRVRESVESLRHRSDGLFVKNLENLQGDERDVIFISYTFGPENPGGRVMQRFGPITQENGWRRLNVLITRARRRIELFTSMDPSDILAGPEKSRGVNAMKDYLEFAHTGHLPDRGSWSGRQPDSPFEIAVMRAVERNGLKVVPQVGVAGYFIDVGVLRPGRSDEFLLGIECDGATYHAAKSTRDRDRLREQIIRERGWNLHRIWSTDWFYNQRSEERRLEEVIGSLLRNGAAQRMGDSISSAIFL